MEDDGKKRALILPPQRMSHAEFVRQDWVVTAEEGTLVSDVLDPGYWSHMAAQMKPYDRVTVQIETGEWMLELLVKATDRSWASVVVLHEHDLEAVAGAPEAGIRYEARFKGPVHKWSVIRLSDGQMLESKLESKQAGNDWIRQYEQTVRS